MINPYRQLAHVALAFAATFISGTSGAASEPAPPKAFAVRDGRGFLGGQPVRLWALRCGHALMDQAMTERCVRSLDTTAAHGINLISVSLQGTNGSFPSVDAGPNAYLPTGALQRAFADRLEWLVREADRRGMVVAVSLLQPRKDQELRDEAAVRRAIEETSRVLVERELKNVFVNLMHEFSHPVRADHEILPPSRPPPAILLVAARSVARNAPALCQAHDTHQQGVSAMAGASHIADGNHAARDRRRPAQ